MNSAADQQTGGADPDSVLLDVSEWTIGALLGEHSALAGALRRREREAHSVDHLIATFGNFAPTEPPDPPEVAVRDA